jgi:hypothetical protein
MALNPALRKLVSQANNKYNRSSGSRLKPKEGINRYRFLVPTKKDAPWLPDNGQFWADLGVHWIKADENGKPLAVVGFQQPSKIAPAIDAAIEAAIDEESKKIAESWKARSSVLVNVLDRSKGSDNPDEPQILELTTTTWGKVMGVIQQYDDEGEDVLDPNSGVDIVITRTGKGLNTEYAVNVAPGKSQPVPAGALKACHDLKQHIEREFFRGDEPKALSYIAQISGVNLAMISGPSTGPRTKTRALSSSAAAVEEAEVLEEDVAEELEELEAELEEAPKPKAAAKPAKKAAPVVEEVDEEEADEDLDLDDVLADLKNI